MNSLVDYIAKHPLPFGLGGMGMASIPSPDLAANVEFIVLCLRGLSFLVGSILGILGIIRWIKTSSDKKG